MSHTVKADLSPRVPKPAGSAVIRYFVSGLGGSISWHPCVPMGGSLIALASRGFSTSTGMTGLSEPIQPSYGSEGYLEVNSRGSPANSVSKARRRNTKFSSDMPGCRDRYLISSSVGLNPSAGARQLSSCHHSRNRGLKRPRFSRVECHICSWCDPARPGVDSRITRALIVGKMLMAAFCCHWASPNSVMMSRSIERPIAGERPPAVSTLIPPPCTKCI